jgi:hypothetical protein
MSQTIIVSLAVPIKGPIKGHIWVPQIFELGVTCRKISHEFQLCLASMSASIHALMQPRSAFAILTAFAYTLKIQLQEHIDHQSYT